MEIKENYPLKSLNTFAIDIKSKFYAAPSSIVELTELLSISIYKPLKKLIIGGGSNLLFTKDFDGMVIHPILKEKTIIEKSAEYIIVKAGAGENWDEFVQWTVENSIAGIENLSLIPGTIGACPVQNIGAYGVEVGDLIEKVEAIEIESGTIREFANNECKFGYRESIFKQELKGRYIITSGFFKLALRPDFKINYGALKEELAKFDEISLSTVRQAIINIRESKLPNPVASPNAGSFFKNPSVSKELADDLKSKFPEMVSYTNTDGSVKLAAGWLIDRLGWKGKTLNDAGVHEKQALVLVNKGNATGNQILELASKIKKSVFQTFGVELEYEVNIV
jgi:UDP-N-acetylmuramate dehydrogenase